MKLNTKLTAVAAGVGLATAGTAAQATNLGEFWATDQVGGVTYIYKQSELNDPTVTANPQLVDLVAAGDASVRMHITGFSNHAGLDPASRAIQTHLGGTMGIWKSNGGPAAPEFIENLQASTGDAYAGNDGMTGATGGSAGKGPDKGNTVHACGGNPQNTQIQCASIFNGDFSLFSADMTTDTYTRLGIWRVADLTVSGDLDPALAATVQAEFDELVENDDNGNPNNICSQYSTDGNLLYLAVQNNATDGGVIVVDVSDASNPTILDAFNDVMAAGCGLVNNPDGKHLWITHGFNKQGDPEEISIWAYNRAGVANGPVDRVALPTDDSQDVYGGDAHGMQYAGLVSSFAWQTMRIDDVIHVVANGGGKGELVNTIDLEAGTGRKNVQPDVLDRSQLGTNMYYSTRGPRPSTAIGSMAGGPNRYNHSDRLAGVDVWATIFGYDGVFVKHESMAGTGGTVYLCPGSKKNGSSYEIQCSAGDKKAKAVTGSDPHGTKSLNYLSGF